MASPLPIDNITSQAMPQSQPTIGTVEKKRSWCRRTVAVISTPLVHLILNIFLGAVKGLERAATEPAELLMEYGQKLGAKNSYRSKIFGALGFFVGFIVGIVAAPIGLLFGLAYGIGRSVYKMPSACQKSYFHGFSYAVNDTFKHFSISGYKVAIIAAVTSLLLASSFIGIAGLIGGAALAGLIVIIEVPAYLSSLTTLAYTYSDKSTSIPISTPQSGSYKAAHINTTLGSTGAADPLQSDR